MSWKQSAITKHRRHAMHHRQCVAAGYVRIAMRERNTVSAPTKALEAIVDIGRPWASAVDSVP